MRAEVTAYWAGEDRLFALSFGDILDIEEACGKLGFGEIYLRLGRHQYKAEFILNILRIGLIGGGMKSDEARRLVESRLIGVGFARAVEVCIDLLATAMEGVEQDDTKPAGDPAQPLDVGAILASFAKLGVSPESVKALSLAEFISMCRAFGGDGFKAPSEAEFEEMLEKFGADG